MFEILDSLKELVQVSDQKVYSTNAVFILHSKLTVVILLSLSILVTSRQYIGDPINCISPSDIKSIADDYCWIHSTYTRTVLTSPDGKLAYGYGYEAEVAESELLAPGIRPAIENDDFRIYHTYYQWVWLVLFLQSGLFYIPYWLWRQWDRGRIKLLVFNLNLEVITSLDDDGDRFLARQKEAILDYLTPNMGRHSGYAMKYIICECLNAVNVIVQIFVTDAFLNWSFSSYGLAIFSLAQRHPYQRNDQLSRVFPTVTACRIATGGVAFGTMEYDLLCVLPINILNEKIYIFLWFWFLGLAFLSVLNLVYRTLLIWLPPLRKFLLQRRLKNNNYFYYQTLGKFQLASQCSYSDWFMLTQIGDNLNPIVFAEILEELQNTVLANPLGMSSLKKSSGLEKSDQSNHIIRSSGLGSKKILSSADKIEEEEATPFNTEPSVPPLVSI